MKPPTSVRVPSPIGPNVFTSPDVDMPPRHPVASTSSTLAPSRAAQIAARAAGRPSACHEDVVLILDRNAAGEGVGVPSLKPFCQATLALYQDLSSNKTLW